MFSGMLASFLKVAAVAVVTGGFVGGIYWAVQISESEDNSPLVQAEATRTVSPLPSTTVTLPQPTPSPPPGTPPAIDTSAWLTYASPLGIEIKYPPDWRIEGPDVTSQPPSAGDSRTNLFNDVIDNTGEAGGTPGVMRVVIRQYPGGFDADLFRNTCELPPELDPRDPSDGPPDRPIDLTVAGRQAVLCERHDISPAGLDVFGFILYVSVTEDSVIEIASWAIAPTENERASARAIVDSTDLSAAP